MEAITPDSRVQIREGDVLFQELQGETVLLNLTTGVYLGLNPIGTRIWRLMESKQSLREVLDAMLQEYDVPEEQLTGDVVSLVDKMRANGLVEVRQEQAA